MGKGYSETKDNRGPIDTLVGTDSWKTDAKDSEGNTATGYGGTPEESQQNASDKLAEKRGEK